MQSEFLTVSFTAGFVIGVVALIWLLAIVLIIRAIVRKRREQRSFNAGFKRMQDRESGR
jgi:hypothetical protein